MNILEIIQLSISNLKSFKFRSFLTMLGIIMGIGSVVLISSLGAGFERKLLADIKNSVKNGVSVEFSKLYTTTNKEAIKQKHYFTDEDIAAINKLPFIKSALPLVSVNAEINDRFTYISGNYSNNSFYIKSSQLTSGRLFFPEEYTKDSNVVLIDRLSAKSLFKNESPIGKTININSYNNELIGKYTIIGTFKSYSENASTIFKNDYIELVAPIQHVNQLAGNINNIYSSLQLDFKNKDTLQDDIQKFKQYLLQKEPIKSDFYEIKPLSEELNQVSRILNLASGFISVVAAISLIVGGIGVMNIMLVSVNERITEIGLRKAIGAKNKDIKLQFLIESMIVTVVGGMIGILIGFGIASIIGIFIKIVPFLRLDILLISIFVSMTIGLLFGIYPAKQAAKLSPIEALRKE
ncbi:ABC transporter permease [Caviibacter abscessus]|uniref:ABC transporter permease n=1 Tax=Caviibacter abscessus TaxID=1766719 RepID=UPI00082A8639|nr:ABC transporter permease [Caviibacter abscessus]